MGRKKIYQTEEEKIQAKKDRWNRWYDKNKESLNKKRMVDYYGKKNNS
jgi:hypothetical protein